MAEAACTALEALAFNRAFHRIPGTAHALLGVEAADLQTLAPFLAAPANLDLLASPRCTVYVRATNDEGFDRRTSDFTLVIDGTVPDSEAGFRHEVTAIRYSIDPNPELEPDPATGEPAKNVTFVRGSWAQPAGEMPPDELISDANERLEGWRGPEALTVNTGLGAATEVGDIIQLANHLQQA